MPRWIKIYSTIKEHWIWQNPLKLKWWLDLLMQAEYEDKKMLLGKKTYLIRQGQLVASISYLQERWTYINSKGKKCIPSPPTICGFLKILKDKEMISLDTRVLPNRITLITILNYSKYQQVSNDINNNQNNTTNNTANNTINNEYKEYIYKKENNKLFSKKETKIVPRSSEQFDFSIVDDAYKEAVIIWLDYKRKRREKYKSQRSFEMLYHKMLKIGTPEAVMEAVENSIANNYAGLFSEKGTRTNIKQQKQNQRQNEAADLIKDLILKRKNIDTQEFFFGEGFSGEDESSIPTDNL